MLHVCPSYTLLPVYIFQMLPCIVLPLRYRTLSLLAQLKQLPNCYMVQNIQVLIQMQSYTLQRLLSILQLDDALFLSGSDCWLLSLKGVLAFYSCPFLYQVLFQELLFLF